MSFLDPLLIPATGQPRIDDGHRELATKINMIYDAWKGGLAGQPLHDEFSLLIRAIGRHFAEEEGILDGLEFAGYDHHKARHVSLLAELTDAVRRIQTSGPEQAINVFRMIDMLIYEHEVLDDQDFWPLFGGGRVQPQGVAVLQWSDAFVTGEGVVDRDHRMLIALLNHLHDLLRRGASADEVEQVLTKILSHTEQHFAWEEGFIVDGALGGLETHQLLHRDLLNDLHQVIDRHRAGYYLDMNDLLFNYMKYWLVDHILNVDAEMVVSGRKIQV